MKGIDGSKVQVADKTTLKHLNLFLQDCLKSSRLEISPIVTLRAICSISSQRHTYNDSRKFFLFSDAGFLVVLGRFLGPNYLLNVLLCQMEQKPYLTATARHFENFAKFLDSTFANSIWQTLKSCERASGPSHLVILVGLFLRGLERQKKDVKI